MARTIFPCGGIQSKGTGRSIVVTDEYWHAEDIRLNLLRSTTTRGKAISKILLILLCVLASRPWLLFLKSQTSIGCLRPASGLEQKIELMFSCQGRKLINGGIRSLRSFAQSA